jgi:competence protein ComEA
MKRTSNGFVILVAMLVLFHQFSFAQAVDTSSSTKLVNINTAGQSELESLPGIGPSLAKKIMEFRQKNGGFKNVNDLVAVPGIGQKKFEQLKNLVTVK